MFKGQDYIYGRHVVSEALQNPKVAISGLWLHKDFHDQAFEKLAKKRGLRISHLTAGELPAGFNKDAVHQGVIALIQIDGLMLSYKDFESSLKIDESTALVLLDEIEDPQNVGALIRSAVAFGLSGVLIPENRQAQITGSVIKVSAGMAFKIPLVSIGNVNATIRDLKDKGFWIYGLTGEGQSDLNKEKFDAPAVFVVGAEGAGIREKTLDLCDVKLRIPIARNCESLNAATSASVAFYEWSRGNRIRN